MNLDKLHIRNIFLKFSYRYHRILKRQRIKDQIREFEELQKKDPEAALKKLEQLEKTRAEERVSLRHRSTGQWAKNQAVRAKYNKEVCVDINVLSIVVLNSE